MNILFRYPGASLEDNMRHFTGHPGKWCWWCIYDVLKELGHNVTPHDWNNPIPEGRLYDAIFSIQHLNGIEHVCRPDTIKIIRLTMADPVYHNSTINQKIDEINLRRGAKLIPRRLLQLENDHYASIQKADYVLLNGNDFIKWTYPCRYWGKISIANTCASNVREVQMRDKIPAKREFLWHAGSGAVHKGLDLCLEVFAKHPEWTLHVTGNLRPEPDFLNEFRNELNLPNIHYHGWVVVSDIKFKMMLENIFAFINPTCSEGQSPAVATCLTLGLYPIISRYTGVDLPDGCGVFIEDLTIDAVEQAIQQAMAIDDAELLRQVQIIQADALDKYSQERFRETMTRHIKEALHA